MNSNPLLFELEADDYQDCGCDTYDDVTCHEHAEYHREWEDYYEWLEKLR